MKIQAYGSIAEIPTEHWQNLTAKGFPFASREFLMALESNQCLGRRTGWEPRFLGAWQDSKLRGLLILFQKTNSYGEYIFDFAWADAHQRNGIEYYPKLVSAIPFTPATGPKILYATDLSVEEQSVVSQSLLESVKQVSRQLQCSSAHALFIPEASQSAFLEQGFLLRHSIQYHWANQGYRSFTEFAEALRSKRRREIYRERKQVTDSGIRIQRLTGDQLLPEHAEWMHGFYVNTVQKMGGYAYLTEGFFQELFRTMKENILFVLATDPVGLPVAGALNLFGGNTLYGRHWGSLDEYKALHFEVCYYQGIEFAIENNFGLFEAGAQGEHKFQRGFLPNLTYSAHIIEDPRFHSAIADFMEREKTEIATLFEEYALNSPFKRD